MVELKTDASNVNFKINTTNEDECRIKNNLTSSIGSINLHSCAAATPFFSHTKTSY